jgi:hypothetical protein
VELKSAPGEHSSPRERSDMRGRAANIVQISAWFILAIRCRERRRIRRTMSLLWDVGLLQSDFAQRQTPIALGSIQGGDINNSHSTFERDMIFFNL